MTAIALARPIPTYDPVKGLLHNDHFQIGYVTNDIDRAVAIFRDRFGVSSFRANDNTLENGARICIRSAWVGAMMYEICQGSGPGMELYTDWAPAGGDFVLRFHHFCYLIPDEAAWTALEAELARRDWRLRAHNDIASFFKGCYIEVPELGHFLEYVLLRPGLLERMNETPAS